jgi:NAD(P)-dependent dehydrogenase (short-subunit alcohol dehydrogenase family)
VYTDRVSDETSLARGIMDSSNRRIVLTGSSKGIGFSLAGEFVRLGHTVEGCSRSGHAAATTTFPADRVDVSDRDQVFRWAERLVKRGYVPDILICNAALINRPAPLWQVPATEVHAIIATNVLGTAYTLQAFLPAMIERGSGLIITLSSGWGRATDPEMAPYCCSKFAVEGLTQALAQELPANLAAVTLSPGIVRTDMLLRCWGERALDYELPEVWAKRAAAFILGLSADRNGSQLTVAPA